jgi:large subunit ribosomal protein L9
MKIILLKDVAKVGKKYEVKNISDGYAQNLLIPKGLAVAATADVMKRIELERARDEGEKRVHMELLLKNLKEVEGKTITLTEKANEKGHLFASVNKPEVILAIHKQTRIQISPDNMMLDKHIKEVGNHEIELKAGDKSVKFTLVIKAE